MKVIITKRTRFSYDHGPAETVQPGDTVEVVDTCSRMGYYLIKTDRFVMWVLVSRLRQAGYQAYEKRASVSSLVRTVRSQTLIAPGVRGGLVRSSFGFLGFTTVDEPAGTLVDQFVDLGSMPRSLVVGWLDTIREAEGGQLTWQQTWNLLVCSNPSVTQLGEICC